MPGASIKDVTLLEVVDGVARPLGCDQDWYRSWWKRTAGCGPSTFANIIYYMRRRDAADAPAGSREDFIRLMEDAWESVTPTMRGLSSTSLFVSGARDFARRHGLDITAAELPVMRQPGDRPALEDVLEFIADILSRDVPVAFLALDNGAETRLDSWHWVTLLSISRDADGRADARILDNGKLSTIDLGCWLSTTVRGGGFAGIY